MKLLSKTRGKHLLCLGSGYGSKCRHLAHDGARVVATDIVIEPLIRMKRLAQDDEATRPNLSMVVADAHRLPFRDECFDVVYGMGVLHHLDTADATGEVHRVMKTGGSGMFTEPLGMNPFINLYRNLTPGIRVESEHPFTHSDLDAYRRTFRHFDVKAFGLFALLAAPFLKTRRVVDTLVTWLSKLDRRVFATVPSTRWWAWAVVIQLRK